MLPNRQAIGLFILLLPVFIFADSLFVVNSLDYSVYLPDNWVIEQKNDSQHYFYDTTYTYESFLSLVRHDIDPAHFTDAREWTETYFTAYLLNAEASYDPWGITLFKDSSDTCTMGELWAPEAYVEYHCFDTAMSWAEYVTYTAYDVYGYELYAAGDTLDMFNNISLYAAILRNIDLPGKSYVKKPFYSGKRNPGIKNRVITDYMFDALGRKLILEKTGMEKSASGLYMFKGSGGSAGEKVIRLPEKNPDQIK